MTRRSRGVVGAHPVPLFLYTDATAFGGAEIALLMLLERLDRRRFAPTLVYHSAHGVVTLARRAQELGADLLDVPPLPLGLTGARRAPALSRLLRRSGAVVFHAHLSSPVAAKWALAAAASARVRRVIATVQLVPPASFDVSTRLQLRLLAAAVDRYITVSAHIGHELERALRIPASKVVVIPNGVDLSRFPPAARSNPTRVTGEPQTVLTVARLHEQKGLEVVVHAARELPGVRFLIAGEGPERPSLERLTRSLGVEERVVLLGHRDDITALLGDADLFVLPSRYEGFPLALLEAMASGVAVVASDIPGITELVTDDSRGLLVTPGDVSGFTRAIGELLGHDARRAALGRAARQLVEERYDADELARRVVAQYDVARP